MGEEVKDFSLILGMTCCGQTDKVRAGVNSLNSWLHSTGQTMSQSLLSRRDPEKQRGQVTCLQSPYAVIEPEFAPGQFHSPESSQTGCESQALCS